MHIKQQRVYLYGISYLAQATNLHIEFIYCNITLAQFSLQFTLLLRHLLLLFCSYGFYIQLALAFFILNDLKPSVVLFSIYSCIFEFILANHLGLALIIYSYHCLMS